MLPYPSPFAHPPLPRAQFVPPPSSQPVRQRTRTVMPFARGVPATNQHIPRRAPAGSPFGAAMEESQFDFPYPPPPPRPPSSRPPSTFVPSQPPSSQVEHEGRESSFPRHEPSYAGSVSDHPPMGRQPMSASQAVVDHYQPPRSGMSKGSARGGAQVYQTAREPKPQKAQEILANLAGLREWLEQTNRDREEDQKTHREAMNERLKVLEKDNRDIKEAIHELGMGQKVLPTKTELGEELTNHISPALETFFDSLHHTIRTTIEPLSTDIPKQTAEKVKLSMLELQDTAKRQALHEGAIETPLVNLMNHLILALSPLQNITIALESLPSLPEALQNVAIFQQAMQEMKDKIERRPQITNGDMSGIESSPLANALKDLSRKIDQIKLQIGSFTPPSNSSDPSQLASAIQTLADRLGESIVARASAPQQPGTADRIDRGINGLHSTGAGLSTTAQTGPDFVPNHDSSNRQEVITTPIYVPKVNLIPPSSEPQFDSPTAIAARNEAIESANWDRTSLTVREEDRHRSPIVPAPSALRDMLIGEDDDGVDDATPPASRGALFAQNNINTMPGTSATLSTDEIVSYSNEKRKRSGSQQITLAQAIADSTIATNHATPSTPAPVEPADAHPVEPAAPEPVVTGTIAQPISQTAESEYVSSGSIPPKRRKTSNNTRAVKQERLSGQLLGYKPTTRSEATKAKEVGFDIINLVDSETSGSRSNSSDGRKSRSRSQQGRWVKSKGKESPADESSAIEQHANTFVETQAITSGDDMQQTQQDTLPSQAPSQPGFWCHNSSLDSDFGHGQPLSVPSLPVFGSSNFTYETQEPTLGSLSADMEFSPFGHGQKQSTSTDRVEASPSLAVAPPKDRDDQHPSSEPSLTTPTQDTLPPVTRSAPPYRRYQAYGKAAHAKKLSMFGKSFAAMDSDDD